MSGGEEGRMDAGRDTDGLVNSKVYRHIGFADGVQNLVRDGLNCTINVSMSW
jgi:hypothetical protein